MEKMKINERGSNHMKSQLERFMRRKGRQFCAAALCVLMLVSNVATSIGSTGEDSNEVAEFTVDRDSLCVELVKAVERGKTVKNTLEFDGEEADTYAELFDADGTLYKLKPEIKDNASKLSLTVYARLGEELEKEERQNYEIDGSEEIIFLLKNEADREQTAVIRVGDKCSEEITVAAKSAVGVMEEETVEETVAGPADENAAPGGGSAADGAAAEETVSDGTLPAEESTAASDTEESKEETSAPTEGAGEQETDAPEQESGSEIEAPKEDGENAAETGEGQEEAADQDEEKTENESGVTEDNGTGSESGTTEGGDTSEKADDGQTAGDDSKSEQDADNSGASEGGSSDNADNSDNSSSDSSDSGDNGSDDSVTASISVHKVARVMTTVEAANGATPQEAEKEETVVEVLHEEEDEATEEEDEATPSEATPSELWELFDGECFDAVCLGDGAAVAFVTTAEELGLDDEIYEAELENVIVRVAAKRGVVPESAILQVTELTEENEETAEQYKEAKRELDNDPDIQYDGMLALDISFFDMETEKEFEPGENVKVYLEMKPKFLPEGVDIETVAVQHLKELKDGNIKVEKVADSSSETSGLVKIKDALDNEDISTVAEFEVDSFSSFTITWSFILSESAQVKIVYVDGDGNEIEYTGAEEIQDKSEYWLWLGDIDITQYAYDIDGYNYRGSYIYNESDGTFETPVVAIRGIWDRTGLTSSAYYLQYKSSINDSWNSLDRRSATIYLVYDGATPTPPETDITQRMSHEKTACKNNDGTYDLTLTISGEVGSITNKAKLDVIYVLDVSGSMDYDMDRNRGSSGERRMAAAKAINDMTTSLVNNTKLDTRFALVRFSGNKSNNDSAWNDAGVLQSWTRTAEDITSKTSPSSNGGTNYQAGIRVAKSLMDSKRTGALTAVVFVSDGDPTYYYGTDGKTQGPGDSDDDSGTCLNSAITEVGTLYSDFFYTVGVGPSGNYTKLRNLKNGAVNVTTKDFYEGTDSNSLEKAFDSIKTAITTLRCSDVTITDTLSSNVKLVTDVSGNPEALTISIFKLKENGEEETAPIAKSSNQDQYGKTNLTFHGAVISAWYDANNQQIIMDFPDDYELEKGYVYKVTAHIEPTEAAYKEYRSNELQYKDVPDVGTGTHSMPDEKEKIGLYSNTEEGATVQYRYNGTETIENYLRPVVKLMPGKLSIEKKVIGNLTENELENLENSLIFNVDLNWDGKAPDNMVDGTEFTLKDMTKSGSVDGVLTYTYEINGLSPNTNFTVTEKNASIQGYDLATTYRGLSETGEPEYLPYDETVKDANNNLVAVPHGEVVKGGEETVSIVNSYSKQHEVTIKKIVDGNMADRDQTKEYLFDYEIYKMVDGTKQTLKSNPDKNPLKVKADGESVVVPEKVPDGAFITITERETSRTEFTSVSFSSVKLPSRDTEKTGSTFTYTSDQILTDIEVTFTNSKVVTIPTGIFINNLPHLLMLAFAFFSTAVLLLFSYKRKVRRAE